MLPRLICWVTWYSVYDVMDIAWFREILKGHGDADPDDDEDVYKNPAAGGQSSREMSELIMTRGAKMSVLAVMTRHLKTLPGPSQPCGTHRMRAFFFCGKSTSSLKELGTWASCGNSVLNSCNKIGDRFRGIENNARTPNETRVLYLIETI